MYFFVQRLGIFLYIYAKFKFLNLRRDFFKFSLKAFRRDTVNLNGASPLDSWQVKRKYGDGRDPE